MHDSWRRRMEEYVCVCVYYNARALTVAGGCAKAYLYACMNFLRLASTILNGPRKSHATARLQTSRSIHSRSSYLGTR